MGGGEQDGEDGRVGAVGHAGGGRVRCGSDGHGVGTRSVAAAVLKSQAKRIQSWTCTGHALSKVWENLDARSRKMRVTGCEFACLCF